MKIKQYIIKDINTTQNGIILFTNSIIRFNIRITTLEVLRLENKADKQMTSM